MTAGGTEGWGRDQCRRQSRAPSTKAVERETGQGQAGAERSTRDIMGDQHNTANERQGEPWLGFWLGDLSWQLVISGC